MISDIGIEHPIPLIENLLKERIGDKGRLLYLRNALKNGREIYHSDKKYLNNMKQKYSKISSVKNLSDKKPSHALIKFNFSNVFKDKSFDSTKKISENYNKKSFTASDFDLEMIQNSLDDLKTKKSKIDDNLKLITINREILTQAVIDRSNSFGSFSNLPNNTPSDLFELIQNPPKWEKWKTFGMRKFDLMAYASAGLFSLWFASFQNLINLGSFQGLSLGLSAGTAVSAGLFYRKQKKEIKQL